MCLCFFSLYFYGFVLSFEKLKMVQAESALMTFKTFGYHTCRAKGTRDELMQKVPFLSRKENQWLGQGYYFWTDDPYWALKWGRSEADIVISEYEISLEKERLLDLVGSVKHQLLFRRIVESFKKKGLLEQYSKKFERKLCVSRIIEWLLEEREKFDDDQIFPFWAVRAKDRRSEMQLPFSPDPHRREELFLVERHQMCVYAAFKDSVVKFKGFVHPPSFKEEVQEA
jgi:hypothetical protein